MNEKRGAFKFECDHVAENFRPEGEASTKTPGGVCNIHEVMKMILEMTQTQLTCGECHGHLTCNHTVEISAMFL